MSKTVDMQRGNKTFRIENPEASLLWIEELNNGATPDNTTHQSRKTVYLRCVNNPDHIYAKPVRTIPKKPPYGCPICRAERNSVSKYPHLVKQWNFEKNKDMDIHTTSAVSSKKAWWKCPTCGYEWQAEIASRKASKGLCPCCEHRAVVVKGITDLFTLVPELKKEYLFEKNVDIGEDKLSVTSSRKVWWKCPTCGHEWQAAPTSRLIYKKGKYVIRSCPACAKHVRTKTYDEEYPALKEQFIESMNNCSLSELTGKDLPKKFWWKCNTCGETFEAALSGMIRSRNTAYKGCPYCAGKKVRRENSFAALHPEVMDEFDPANEIDPYSITEKTDKIAKWICRNNPEHRWEASFAQRAKGYGSCPICKDYRFETKFTDVFPEYEQYYDTHKNVRPFKSYSLKSCERVWWKCEQGHEFQRTFYTIHTMGRFECPVCSNKILVKGLNDLQSQYPELAKEFDVEKNGITPDQVRITDWMEYWWKCEHGHEFKHSVKHRVFKVSACPVCERNIVSKGANDFQTKYPKITEVWDYDKNTVTPDQITDLSNKKFCFTCKEGHSYEAQLTTMINNNFECLVCSSKQIQIGVNSLIDTHPALAKEWSPNNERGPETFKKSQPFRALWICPECGGEYHYPINEREVGDNSCPYCNNRKALLGFNSLVDTHPELIKEWSFNNTRSPESFLKSNTYNALWICPECGGEYSHPINDRETGDDSCPYCSNKRVLPGFNSFKVRHPDLMEEWDFINNYLLCDADQILDNYSHMVWWKCPTCGHHYEMSPKRRLYYQKRHKKACLYCKGLRRKKHYFFKP